MTKTTNCRLDLPRNFWFDFRRTGRANDCPWPSTLERGFTNLCSSTCPLSQFSTLVSITICLTQLVSTKMLELSTSFNLFLLSINLVLARLNSELTLVYLSHTALAATF